MTAGAGSRPNPPGTGTLSPAYYTSPSPLDSITGTRLFKKHKVLPHPGKERAGRRNDLPHSLPTRHGLEIDTSLSKSSGSQPSSPTLRHQSRRIGGGPDPPPTPPAHSRNSSSGHSTLPSSLTYVASSDRSVESVQAPSPATPTNQQSPPTPNLTPERTPPGHALRPARPRPPINDRMPSKATTDSRTESFKTAPENPYSSEEEDGKSTVRQLPPSTRTSQTTVRQLSGGAAAPSPDPQAVGLGLGLESSGPEDDLTPRTRREFASFDGGWGSASEVEQEWDDNLMRNVTIKKRRPGVNGSNREVVEDATVTPTNATMALRSVSLQESPLVYPPRRVVSDRVKPSAAAAPSSISESSTTNMDIRRSSGISTKSTVSTVVEAILVDGPPPPQRRKTLRHVKKQAVLRDSGLDLTSTGSIPTSLGSDEPRNQERPNGSRPRQERVTSTSTFNSVSSHKARRDVWKNGGIPVVVVPGRNSSIKSSSKEPSLRSTSSRRSKRSHSLSSGAIPQSAKGTNPHFERPQRRSRTLSESDGSRSGDQRTIDYPPVVPARSSSLSAPTSRNTSRAGSLTAQSLEAHNAIHAQQTRKALQAIAPKPRNELHAPERTLNPQPLQHIEPRRMRQDPLSPNIQSIRSFESSKSDKEAHNRGIHDDGYGDPFFGRRLSVQRTPFSQISVETAGTSHAEVSEALAVNIYPHQNKSVLMVDHSNKPSETSSSEQTQRDAEQEDAVAKTTETSGTVPVTPPQPAFSMDDVDSPLRNPRAPPEPPAIQFIPATPSGLTPAQEKEAQLGNYFEETAQKPSQPMSILRRTLSRRRHSEYGPSATPARRPSLLTRTFSLSKTLKNEPSEKSRGKAPATSAYPTAGDRPADEDRLHPFWRPAYSDNLSRDDEDCVHDVHDEEYLRYPAVDNRPNRPAPQRSLSARMKRTFAILPIRDDRDEGDNYYELPAPGVTAHRSIRRTPSGNLRVVKYRRSLESLRRQARALDERPYTAPNQGVGLRPHRFWRSNSTSRRNLKTEADATAAADAAAPGAWPNFLPGLGSKFEKYGLHNLPRRLSERQREKRSRELRQKISGPREVRDGVGDVIRKDGWRDAFQQPQYD